jgi:hypothetical protein
MIQDRDDDGDPAMIATDYDGTGDDQISFVIFPWTAQG